MKRTLSVLVALIMLLTLTPAFAAQEEINIFMWSDYISDDLIANFEDEYGVRNLQILSMRDLRKIYAHSRQIGLRMNTVCA